MLVFASKMTGGSDESLRMQAELSLVANFLGMLVQLLFAPTEETALILFSARKNPDLKALSFWMQIMISFGTLAVAGT
jgi:hypothetical protein